MEHHHMIEAFATNGSDHPLAIILQEKSQLLRGVCHYLVNAVIVEVESSGKADRGTCPVSRLIGS